MTNGNGTSMTTTLKKEDKVEKDSKVDKEIDVKKEPKLKKESKVKKTKSITPEEELYNDIVDLWGALESAVKSKSLHRAKKPLEDIKRKYKKLFL
jgi:hypothetical protein